MVMTTFPRVSARDIDKGSGSFVQRAPPVCDRATVVISFFKFIIEQARHLIRHRSGCLCQTLAHRIGCRPFDTGSVRLR